MGSIFRRSYIDKRTGQRKLARRYSVRFKDAQGRWRTEPTSTCRRPVAQRILLEREQTERIEPAARLPALPQGAMILLAELSEAYLADRKLRVKSSTWELYRERLRFTLAELRVEAVSQLTRGLVETYVQERLRSGSTSRTVNLQVAVLKRMFHWAVRQEWMGLLRNPLETWEPLKETPRRRPALKEREIQQLLRAAPVHRRMIWAVMLATGLRRSEAIALEQSDFHRQRSTIMVRAELTKSARTRIIPIPMGLASLLNEWLARESSLRPKLLAQFLDEIQTRLCALRSAGLDASKQADNLRNLEAKVRLARRHQPLFRNGRGLPYLKSNLLREFRRDLKAAALPSKAYDLHCLRVTNATYLRAAQVPDIAIKQRLGHVSLQTTDRHYVDFELVDQGQGTNVIGKLIGVECSSSTAESAEQVLGLPLTLHDRELLRPSPEVLWQLVPRFSNQIIGRICGVSEAAVRKWLRAANIVRETRKVCRHMTEVELALLRSELRQAIKRDGQAAERKRTAKPFGATRRGTLPGDTPRMIVNTAEGRLLGSVFDSVDPRSL